MSNGSTASIVQCGITALVAVIALPSIYGAAQRIPQKLHKHVPSIVSSGHAEFVRNIPTTQTIDMTIIISLRNQARLSSLLKELYDPLSPQYRQFLSVEEFTDQFGPTEQDYESVIQWAKNQGWKIKSESKNRLILNVSGTAAQVNAALNVSMNLYLDTKENRTFYSSDREPTLNLSTPVVHIQGLNNYSVPQPMVKLKKNAGPVADVTGSGPGGYYLGSDMRAAYYGGTQLTGVGQCVGLLEFGGYRLNDVNLTFATAGQTYNVPINNVLLDGVSAAAGSDDSEQVLDIVQAIGMAPGLSQVRVYIGNSDADMFNSMATENVCKQLSVSWSWAPDDSSADDGIFQEFAAQGQSVFVASGDYGAYDGAVDPDFYPAEDAYVTAVGGTHLDTSSPNGSWVAESAWNNPPYGSGGGISPDYVPIPTWQQGVPGSLSLRNVPDVSMEADNDNYFCDLGTCTGGAGGTSFAAPRWAAFMALVNQLATESGTVTKGGIGFLNPAIYSIGAGANYTTDFHDITLGNNDTDNQPIWYSAAPGYDLVTGWGSPNGQNLINALAGSLLPGFWLSDSPAAIFMTQGSSMTTTVSVSDAEGFSSNVSLAATGLPSGVTASFNPSSTAGTSVLTLTASGSAVLGTATITITGTSGAHTAQAFVFLTVNSVPPVAPPVGALGSENVGSTSSAVAETLTFTTAGTLGNISVLTMGIPNLDFTNASGGTCSTGKSYKASATCTVKVTFSPKYAGTRNGAVVLTDSSGNQLANLYLEGTGLGPKATFGPGIQTSIGSGFLNQEAAATLGDGSVYVTDYGTGSGVLYLEKFANGTYTQSNTNCTLTSPTGVAVDGSGAIYVDDPGYHAVYKIRLVNGACVKTSVGSGIWTPWGVAVDGEGDVYITDLGLPGYPPTVYKETLQANGSYVQSTIGSGWVAPFAVAVDAKGNVDVVDYSMPGVFMETPTGGSYTQTAIGESWTAPSGIAIDGGGDIYVSDAGSIVYGGQQFPAAIYKEVAAEGSWVQSMVASGWVVPRGIAVDASGNLYVPDQTRGVYKIDLADPPSLSFANTATAAVSSDSPKTVTISNIGTAALQFSQLSYPADFPEANGISTDCTASTSLAAESSCTLSIEFLPTSVLGSNNSLALNESVNITTNNLNNTTQKAIAVSGTEVLPVVIGTVTLSASSNPTAAGTPVTFTATITGRNGGPVPTGTASLYEGAVLIAGPLALTNGVAIYTTGSLAIGTYSLTASYSGDTNYGASNSNAVAESIVPAPGTFGFSDASIGTQNVGSATSAIPLTVTFSSAETLGGISVLTEGAPNLDFANANGGTCSIGTAYAVNSNCTVNISFTPQYSGARFGAVVLSDNNGNPIGTGYLEGTGLGPQTVFLPGILTSIGSGFSYPQGTAVDGSGNVYVADAANATVYKETLTDGSYTQSSLGSGFSQPYAVTVDGAGNVYIADAGTHVVYEEIPGNGTYAQVAVGSGFVSPTGVAVDAAGNLYVADFGNGVTPGAVYLESPSNGTYTQSTIGSGFVTPQGVGVDAAGNVYVVDPANGNGSLAVYKLMPSNGSYNQTTIGAGWVTPTGIAVDGNGNLFVTDDAFDLGDGFVAKETPQPDGSYMQSTVLTAASTPYPGGISVDGKGNLYIGDNLDGVVYRDDLSDPLALTFANTPFGSTSSDSPKIISVENVGNANLAFSGLTYSTDFPEQQGNPTDCTSSTSLVAGASCTLSIDFTPASPSGGQPTVLNENVAITTNSLNVGSTTQTLAVSGTESASVAPTASVALSAPANVATVGASLTFTAAVTGQSGVAAPTGSVTFYENGSTLGTVALNNGSAGYSANFASTGNYGVSATYSGDVNYPSATSNTITAVIIPTSTFGTQNVASSISQTFTITFASRITLGSIAVVTQGMPNLDFTNAGGGTCSVGTAYAAGASCTVKVAFQPLYSGTRHGAIVLGDNNGNLIQTIFLQGTGTGPQLSYSLNNMPPAVKPLGIGPPSPYGVMDYTVDDSADVYILEGITGSTSAVTKWTLTGGSYASSVVPTSSLTYPSTIGVDSAGSVYVLAAYSSKDTNGCKIVKETLVAAAYKETIVTEQQTCTGWIFAVDAAGNVYIGDHNSGNPQVLKETLSGSTYIQSTIVPAGTLYSPESIAVDGSGNMYIDDNGNQSSVPARVIKFSLTAGGTYVPTTLQSDSDTLIADYGKLVVDGNGSLYVNHIYIDSSTGHQTENILKLLPSGTGYTATTMIPGGLQQVGQYWSLGIDANQNLYTLSSQISKFDFSDPPSVSFGSTNVGIKSGDSPQIVALTNVGNAPLAIAVPSAGTNPSITPSSFALDSLTTCPQVTAAGSAATLNVASSCAYLVDFTPTATGSLTGSILLTDNALNAAGGMQTIPLNGTGSAQSQTVLLTRGSDGKPRLKWLPLGSSRSNTATDGVWIDSDGPTFVVGAAEFVSGTCTEVAPAPLTVANDVLGAQWSFKVENVTLTNTQCPSNIVYQFYDAYAVWGSSGRELVDPFTLNVYFYRNPPNDLSLVFQRTLSSNTEFAKIAVTAPQPAGPGSNPPLSAWASLTNPPLTATNVTWTIDGGNGAVQFSNGQATIEVQSGPMLPPPPVQIQELNPTGIAVNFMLKVEVSEQLIVGKNVLEYGETPECFCPPFLTFSTPLWFFGKGITITSPETFTLGDVKTTIAANGASGGSQFNWAIMDGSSKASFASGSQQNSATTSVNSVTLYSTSFSTSTNDITVQLSWTPSGGSQVIRTLSLTVDSPYKLVPQAPIDNGASGNSCDNPPPGTLGYNSEIPYTVQSFLGENVVGMYVNEAFTGDEVFPEPYSGSNWPAIQVSPPVLTDSAGFFDGICIINSSGLLDPAPENPQPTLTDKLVSYRPQAWYVGSAASGEGVEVQADTLQRYLDHGRHVGPGPPGNPGPPQSPVR